MLRITKQNAGELVPLLKLAEKNGGPLEVSESTLTNWRLIGTRGRKLACKRIGGTWYTTWQALNEFGIDNDDPLPGAPAAPLPPSEAAVEQELDQLGV